MNGPESLPVPEPDRIATLLSAASDADLVAIFRAGHLRTEAYEVLMHVRYRAALEVWAKTFARGPLGWEDLAQSVHEVMLDRKLATYNPTRGDFPGFLFTVVYYLSLDLLRRERYRQTGEHPPEPVGVDETALAVALREAERRLWEQVGKLEGQERAVMESCLRGRCRAETCAELGLQPWQYDNLIAAAREKLKQRLPDLCAGLPPQTRGRPKSAPPAAAPGDGSAEASDAQ